MEKSVAVIGAGAAGLVSARELLSHGHKVVIFEQNNRIGGTWVYDPRTETDDELGTNPTRTRIHTSMYKSLRTNLPREGMSFSDFPFTLTSHGDARRFPGHEEVLAYLDSFAQHFNLLDHVRLSTSVSYAGLEKKKNGSNWLVRSIHASGTETTEVFEAVVVCTGHYAQPRVAQIPGAERWPGKQVHSHNYRTPEAFKDKVVAVIGNAPSGRDISRDISTACKHIYWCARAWEDISKPMQQANITKHLMIFMAEEDGTLHFEDGTSAVVDVILHCTGYLYDFPFLDTGDYVTVEDNRVGPLYKQVFPPALAPGLSFVGLPWKILPFPVCELQARWISSVLRGETDLPSVKEMDDDVRTLYEEHEARGVLKRHTHLLGQAMFEYGNWLAEESKSSTKIEGWRKEMYLATGANMKENPDGYRDEWIDEDLHKTVVEKFQR